MVSTVTPAGGSLWRASHVAKLLGLDDPRTVNNWAKAGKIPAIELPTAKDGRRQFRYVPDEIEAWLDGRRNQKQG